MSRGFMSAPQLLAVSYRSSSRITPVAARIRPLSAETTLVGEVALTIAESATERGGANPSSSDRSQHTSAGAIAGAVTAGSETSRTILFRAFVTGH